MVLEAAEAVMDRMAESVFLKTPGSNAHPESCLSLEDWVRFICGAHKMGMKWNVLSYFDEFCC